MARRLSPNAFCTSWYSRPGVSGACLVVAVGNSGGEVQVGAHVPAGAANLGWERRGHCRAPVSALRGAVLPEPLKPSGVLGIEFPFGSPVEHRRGLLDAAHRLGVGIAG